MTVRFISRAMLAWAFSFSLVFSSFARAAAATIQAPTKAQQKVLLTGVLQATRTPAQSVALLAMNGASSELVQELDQEIDQAGVTLPLKITLNEGKILVDGKPTGIMVTSYSPLNIEYKGQVWSYDRTKNVDENFYSLRKMLSDKKVSSLMDLFVNQAQAADEKKEPSAAKKTLEKTGDWISNYKITTIAVGGAIVTVALLPAVATSAVVVGGFVLALSAAVATDKYTEKCNTQSLYRVFNQDFNLTCTDRDVRVEFKDGSGMNFPHISRGEKRENIDIELWDKNKTPIHYYDMSRDQATAYGNLTGCRTKKDAEKLKKEILLAKERWAKDPKSAEASAEDKKTIREKLNPNKGSK